MNWIERLEQEKQKLNQLGNESLANGIPLYANDTLLSQSRKVDELIVLLQQRRLGRKQQSS